MPQRTFPASRRPDDLLDPLDPAGPRQLLDGVHQHANVLRIRRWTPGHVRGRRTSHQFMVDGASLEPNSYRGPSSACPPKPGRAIEILARIGMRLHPQRRSKVIRTLLDLRGGCLNPTPSRRSRHRRHRAPGVTLPLWNVLRRIGPGGRLTCLPPVKWIPPKLHYCGELYFDLRNELLEYRPELCIHTLPRKRHRQHRRPVAIQD